MPNGTEYGLSNVSLKWMIKHIMLTDCNILFDHNELDRLQIPGVTRQDSSSSDGQGSAQSEDRPGGDSDDRDRVDAMEDITDQLWITPWCWAWWILEFLPIPYTFQGANGLWITTWW